MNNREKKLGLQLLFSALFFIPSYYLIVDKIPLMLIGFYVGCFAMLFTCGVSDDVD